MVDCNRDKRMVVIHGLNAYSGSGTTTTVVGAAATFYSIEGGASAPDD